MKGISTYRLAVLIVTSAMLFLLSWYSSRSGLNECKPEKYSVDIRKQFLEKHQELEVMLDGVATNPALAGENALTNYLVGKGNSTLSLFLYKQKKIIFWSDHYIAVPEVFDSTLLSSPFAKIGSVWCGISVRKQGDSLHLLGIIPVYREYAYENEYLVNGFAEGFSKKCPAKVSDLPGKYSVMDGKGNFAFSLDFSGMDEHEGSLETGAFVLFILGYLLFLLFLMYAHRRFNPFESRKSLPLLFFLADALIVRGLFFIFRFPEPVFDTEVFGPQLYAYNSLLPSFGDLALHIITLFAMAYALFRSKGFMIALSNRFGNLGFRVLIVLMVFGLLYVGERTISSLVINSSIPLNISNVLELSPVSFLAFALIGCLWLSLLLLSLFLLKTIKTSGLKIQHLSLPWLISAMIVSFLVLVFHKSEGTSLLFVLIFPLIAWRFLLKDKELRFFAMVAYLLFFSLFSTYSLYRANYTRELDERKLIALGMSSEQDPIAESRFAETENLIYEDVNIHKLLQNKIVDEDSLVDYILATYFSESWNRYKFQVTVCSPTDTLLLKTEARKQNCVDFFRDLVRQYGKFTFSNNLFYIDNKSWENNYVGILRFQKASPQIDTLFVFVEISAKYIPKDLGYPELLIDKRLKINTRINRYSYARYFDGSLLSRFGKCFYPIQLDSNMHLSEKSGFTEEGGFNHLIYQIDDSNVLIISREKYSQLSVVAPFSYLFIYFGLVFLFLLLVVFHPFVLPAYYGFRYRLQVSFSGVIIISFLLIGGGTLYHLQQLNTKQNLKVMEEKAHSLLIELEHKLSAYRKLTPENRDYFTEILIKFSKVFFSDLNLYDPNGLLLASSRNEIFDENLISRYMNPKAYQGLKHEHRTFMVLNEQIGGLEFTSAYVPFMNNNNEVVAYLNLPYFARQSELLRDISNFLVAIINLYLILIVIAVVLALVLSGLISRPLSMIRESLVNVQVGKTNQKILWSKKDEIGELVAAYNRMIDELESSAKLLAQSERESAWSEMARQVAHEIKNPLTPMRLSVQHLQKAWDDNVPDWEERLKRFGQTLIEQIDTLSAIASAFSNFAQLPKARNTEVKILETLENSIALFSDEQKIDRDYCHNSENLIVLADHQQLLRLFNNLLKNAVQAVENQTASKIIVGLKYETENALCIISIRDNGVGINDELKPKIFSPYFTTKSSGMGLGLAMAKSIVEQTGGKIYFESEPEKGTEFVVELPLIKQIENE